MENIIIDFAKAYDFNYIIFRYFNVIGAHKKYRLGQDIYKTCSLVSNIFKVLKGNNEFFELYGNDYSTKDGTCIRDYMHVDDVAKAHIMAMEKMFENNVSLEYNLGNGTGFSVREIIDTVKNVTKREFSVVETERRPGDPALLIADPTKLMTDLNWTSSYDLNDIIESAWKWEQNKKY